MQELPDVLASNLILLFVGFNPSLVSAETGHHYANPRNRFWQILAQSGLTDRVYRPEEDGKLLQLGYGLTNIVARPTRSAEEIAREEYAEGRLILRRKIERYKPRYAVYVGKGIYRHFSGQSLVRWGLQPESAVEGTRDYVCPSSSGLVRMPIADIVAIYRELGRLIRQDAET